jgi:hypothetical protein
MDTLLVFLFFGLLVAGLIALAIYLNHLRDEMWRELAERHGFRYHDGDPLDIRERQHGFALFELGHSPKVLRTLEGTWQGVSVVVFDYRYKTGSGKNQSTHHLTAIMADLPISCPRLRIRPEHFGDRIASALGFDDIDLEYEQFNEAFHVSGDDKKFAYDICHPQMMEFLLTAPTHCWELVGDRLLLYSHRRGSFDREEFEQALSLVAGFVEHIPDHVRRT